MGKSRRTVQIVILLLILVLGGYAITTSVSGSNGKPKEGDKAPSFELLAWMVKCIRLKNMKVRPW